MELPKTDALVKDLETTEADDTQLIASFEKLDADLAEGEKVASIPADVASKLDTLDDDLGTVSDVLAVLVVVPVVDDIVDPISVAVRDMKKLVDPVRQKADAFAKKMQPIQNGLATAEKAVKGVIGDLQTLEQDVTQFHGTLQTTEACVDKSGNQDLATALETFSGGVDPQVQKLNTALADANSVAAAISNDLSSLKSAFDIMVPVEKEIDSVIDALSGISATLGKIRSLLDKKISVPYGFKVKGPWYEPWKWHIHTVTFTFSVGEIFKGINTGVSFVNDELMKLAKDALNALHISLPGLPQIPGLSNIEKAIDSAEAAVGQIVGDLTAIEGDIVGIERQLSAIEQAIKSFNVNCK